MSNKNLTIKIRKIIKSNQPMTPTTTTTYNAAAKSPPVFPPSPAPTPSLSSINNWSFPTLPVLDTTFDIITIGLIFSFLFLSLLCFSFILHLRIKSRHFFNLQSFSSHWAPRFLLVVLLCLWSINEFFRLPIFRKGFIFPSLPSLPLSHQTHFCKFHLILSFGLYEPGFLVVLLFLVNISIKKRSPGNLWAIGFVAITCLPLVVALYFAIYVLPGHLHLPSVFYRSSLLLEDKNSGAEVVYCTYPLLGSLIFGGFCIVYMLALLSTCTRVVALVINKRLKVRISMLVWTLMACLATQVLLMIISAFWDPVDVWFYVFVFVIFFSVITCGVIIEGVLVIMPTTDSLDVACFPREEEGEHIDR